MTTTWVILGVFGAIVASAVGWVAWRDRQRTAAAEDPGARQAAVVQQQRYEMERQHAQNNVIRRGEERSG